MPIYDVENDRRIQMGFGDVMMGAATVMEDDEIPALSFYETAKGSIGRYEKSSMGEQNLAELGGKTATITFRKRESIEVLLYQLLGIYKNMQNDSTNSLLTQGDREEFLNSVKPFMEALK